MYEHQLLPTQRNIIMTVASINSTVTVTVAAELGMHNAESYAPAINKVSEALEAREYDIVDAIVEAAKGYVHESEVRSILKNVGLAERPAPVVVPEPEVEEEAVTAGDVASGKRSKGQRIADLEKGQAQILAALNGLTALAERHLGASL
jgi:hypothetical protein